LFHAEFGSFSPARLSLLRRSKDSIMGLNTFGKPGNVG
jgi:hypothetical protein